MARYLVTTKASFNSAGYHIEPGMSVEIASLLPVGEMGGLIAAPVNNAFMAKYGVDLKAMGCLNAAFLNQEYV